jgi:hypothetical protein
MDEKQLKEFTDGLNKKFDDVLAQVGKKADSEKITEQLKSLQDEVAKMVPSEQMEKAQKQLDELDNVVQSYKTNFTKEGQETVQQQLKRLLQSDDYKKAIKDKRPHELLVKANELTTSNSFTETNGPVIQRLYEPGIVSAPVRATPIWNTITKSAISTDYAIMTERSSQTIGATATNIAEAGVFGQSYSGYTTYKFGVHKIGEYFKISAEKLEDWEYVRGEVMDQLMNNIPYIRETKFLTGYDASINWSGLINTTSAVAKTFAKPTGLDAVSFANNFDVIKAAALQVRLGNTSLTGKKGYNANICLLNPVDLTNLKYVKDQNGNYVRPLWVSGDMMVDGVRLVECDDITAGTFLIGDFTQAKAWVNRALTIKMFDQNDTDPIYDLITFTASHRLAFGVGATRAYAFVYGTFADAISKIVA